MRYIALLRGINVGGHNVKMEALRGYFAELGLENVSTFIQSGNVFFDSDEPAVVLSPRIEKHLLKKLGYDVPVFLRTAEQLQVAIEAFPSVDTALDADVRLCIVFVDEMPKLTFPLSSPKGDMTLLAATKREVFVIWEIIGGRPPTAAFQDKTLGKRTTTRFLHTARKILEAATQ